MATKQLLFSGVSIGSIFTKNIGNNAFIRLNGNTTSGSPTITSVADNGAAYFGVSELRVGMELISSGPFGTKVTITNISGASPNATITVDSNAATTTTGNLLRVDPGPGQMFIESGSMAFPSGQSELNASDVTGSADAQYQAGDLQWAFLIPVAKDGLAGTQRIGQFAQFSLANVQSRPGGATALEVNMYLTASGGDMNGLPSGMTFYTTTTQGALVEIGPDNKVGPIFVGSDAGINNSFGLAAGQIMAANLMDSVSTGSGGSGFPFTGSAQITGSIGLTGSQANLIQSAENFIIKNATAPTQSLFEVKGDDVAVFRANNTGTPPSVVLGGLYFTTESAFLGVN